MTESGNKVSVSGLDVHYLHDSESPCGIADSKHQASAPPAGKGILKGSVAMSHKLIFVTLLAAITVAGASKRMHRDYVPDEKTAVRIAEAILDARFGEERVDAQRPFRGSNSYKDVWIVKGDDYGLPDKGGGMAVWINKYSGCIENVQEHMK